LVPAPPIGIGARVSSTLARSALLSSLKSATIEPFQQRQQRGIRGEQLAVLEPPQGEWQRAWAITDRIIERLADDARSHRVPLLLVFIPDPCQIYADSCRTRPDLVSSDEPQRRLAAVASATGLPFVDLLPPFRAYARANDQLLYYRGDIHCNEIGHRVAAQAIAVALGRLIR
jgi:hypothetical protein